jgi:antitoxin (DNA-binding transcriptional repressor) of toxin-antitoxin stability system
MRRISASKFKEQCLSLLDDLGAEGIVITKRGKPVAKVIPIGSGCAALIGSMKGKLKIKGNLLSTGIRWNAEYCAPMLNLDTHIPIHALNGQLTVKEREVLANDQWGISASRDLGVVQTGAVGADRSGHRFRGFRAGAFEPPYLAAGPGGMQANPRSGLSKRPTRSSPPPVWCTARRW